LQVRVSTGKYKKESCILLENEKLMVKILPQYGGKIQSIFHKEKQKEYLYQSPTEKYKKPYYGMPFGEGECSGFDEMFPAISKCYYPSWPWEGIKIPDHGEVWAIPWEYEVDSDTIVLTVNGVRFPYKLKKEVGFINNHMIQIKYQAINYSNYNFKFIWAAHPLFYCSENTRIILPNSVKKIINVYNKSKRLGEYGKIHPWPIAYANMDNEYDMSKICSRALKVCEKYYVLNNMDEGWCSLHDSKTGDIITLSYPFDKVPYLGIWINEGGYLGQYNIALEPCTGAFDRIDIANQWNRCDNYIIRGVLG